MPYLQTLGRPRGAWWRLVTVVVASAVGLFVVANVAAVLVLVVARLVFDPDFDFDIADGVNAGEIFAINLGLACLIPLAWGLARSLYGVQPAWLASHRPGLRWKWLWMAVGVAAVVWSLFWGLGTLAALVTRDEPLDWGVLAFIITVLLTTPFQAAGEEYLFRGVMLQALGAVRAPAWLACVVSGGLFAVAHQQFDPPLFADRFVLGIVLAYLAVKTGGLEASIAIHAVANISVFLPAGLLDRTSDALDPDNVSWAPLVVQLALLAIAVPWLLYLYRSRRSELDPSAPRVAPPWMQPPT